MGVRLVFTLLVLTVRNTPNLKSFFLNISMLHYLFRYRIGRIKYVNMKTNKLLDEIRQTVTPQMKCQMELSVMIANRIYEILEEKGLSQKDLAHVLGKTETEVSRWLSGTHNMTLATIAKISTALDTDIVKVPVRKKHL